jgi:polysaccharide export outer membrane protein
LALGTRKVRVVTALAIASLLAVSAQDASAQQVCRNPVAPRTAGGASAVSPAGAPTTRTAAQDAAAAMGRNVTNAEIASAIQRSGLSRSQVRERLAAAGYDASLADPFFTTGGLSPTQAQGDACGDLAIAFRQFGVMGDMSSPSPDSLPADRADSAATSGPDRRVAASRVFGAQLFSRDASAFDAVIAGPVDPSYRLGFGDMLQVVVTGEVELAYELEVRRDGSIVIPSVGRLPLAGLRLDAARTVLRDRAGRVYPGVTRGTTDVDLSLSRIRTNLIYVIGDVREPGAYQVNALSTVLTALSRAGGPSSAGSLREIELRRGASTVTRFDLYEYLLRGDQALDTRIEQGDVIFVPVGQRHVEIRGAVRRPALFELRSNESFATLLQFAGGFEAGASLARVQIDRILPVAARRPGAERTVLDIPLQGSLARLDSVSLQDGDIVTVFRVAETRRNQVVIEGAVNAPGTYEWRSGMTLADLLARAQDATPWALRDRIKISRQVRSTGETEFLSIDASSPTASPVALEEFDIVTVLDNREQHPAESVTISGAVHDPGTHPHSRNITLGDLVDLADGLKLEAQLVEVARRPAGAVVTDTAAIIERFSVGAGVLPAEARAFRLERGDQVYVRESPGYRVQETVSVSGAFAFPGTFVIASDSETVRSLIRRAGDVLPHADRRSLRLFRTGRQVPIEYDRVMRDDPQHNIPLFTGDVLRVSRRVDVVSVNGGVERQVAVPWQRGWSVNDYVDAAGGFAEQADRRRIVVEYTSGAVERRKTFLRVFRSDPSVAPGATISVGVRPEQVRGQWRETLTVAMQVTSTVVSVAVAYLALTK